MTKKAKVTISITALGVIWLGFRIVPFLRAAYYSTNYSRVGNGPVTLNLEPETVSRGSTFSLVGNFGRAYDMGNQGWYLGLHIIDQDNKDVLLRLGSLLTVAGYSSYSHGDQDATKGYDQALNTVAQSIDSQTGVIADATYGQLIQRKSNTKLFFIEETGCRLGFGPPTEPPTRYTDRLSFHVLPKTPPGVYIVKVEPYTYCNSLPKSTIMLTLTIK